MNPKDECLNIIEVITHLEGLIRKSTDPAEIADYTRQIVKWRQRLAELKEQR